MGATKSLAIEEANKLNDQISAHLEATGGTGCGDMSCTLCGTYADQMRADYEAWEASETFGDLIELTPEELADLPF